MSMLFADLYSEVARRGTKSQSGSEFTAGIKTAINNSLFRIAREAPWRCLRRTTKFNTITSYTTGTGGATTTLGSTAVTITGATLLTDKVQINRKIKLQNSGKFFRIATITGETTLTLDQVFDGASGSGQTYEIMPQEEYALPPQVSHRMFMWHEMYGYPFKMTFMTDQDFFNTGLYLTIKYMPTHYRMWGENDVISQPKQSQVLNISSSSSTDLSIPITIFGTVSGYPDSETVYTDSSNGSSTVATTKYFSEVERVAKGSSTIGRITIKSDGNTNIVAVLPVGDTTAGIKYSKVQLYPLPTLAGIMNVWYYKDPYRLVGDNDVHEMGQEFDEAIILLATSKIKAEADIAEGDKFYLLYREELLSLRKTNVDKPDFFATLRRPGGYRGNDWLSPSIQYKQFGANFGPSGRY